jgi:hypothetical protein
MIVPSRQNARNHVEMLKGLLRDARDVDWEEQLKPEVSSMVDSECEYKQGKELRAKGKRAKSVVLWL